jgi:hypothetical protein
MSHAARISSVGTGAPNVARGPLLATLASGVVLVAILVVVALLAAATGSGGSTESNVADNPRGADAAPIVHPRGAPLLRPAPARGTAPIVPER